MGERYDTILVPTDGSAGMERVYAHARTIARDHDATVHTLYVVEVGTATELPMDFSAETVRSALEVEGENALAEAEQLLDGVAVESVTVDGKPATEILDYAHTHGVDVIVMGTHGRGGLDRLLLGSVAERVVRRSRVPVLTVRIGNRSDDESD